MSDQPSFPAGWYDDPDGGGGQRFFDGAVWTENRTAPLPDAPPPSNGSTGKKQEADGVIITGYILAVLMPLIGFIIGLTQINKNRHGLWIVLASIVVFFLWIILIGVAAEDTSYNGGGYNY